MIAFAKKSPARNFIIATESGILHSLKKQFPEKNFIPATEKAICPNMKKVTLEKILWALEDMQYKVTVDEDIRGKARAALGRMLEVIPS